MSKVAAALHNGLEREGELGLANVNLSDQYVLEN